MENFNKNWLVILLVAVIFGMLGFLLGRTTGHAGHEDVEVEVEGSDEAVMKTDTIMKDGKQIIIKEVRKFKKD